MILLDFQFGSLQICCGFTAERNNHLEQELKRQPKQNGSICVRSFLGYNNKNWNFKELLFYFGFKNSIHITLFLCWILFSNHSISANK